MSGRCTRADGRAAGTVGSLSASSVRSRRAGAGVRDEKNRKCTSSSRSPLQVRNRCGGRFIFRLRLSHFEIGKIARIESGANRSTDLRRPCSVNPQCATLVEIEQGDIAADHRERSVELRRAGPLGSREIRTRRLGLAPVLPHRSISEPGRKHRAESCAEGSTNERILCSLSRVARRSNHIRFAGRLATLCRTILRRIHRRGRSRPSSRVWASAS